MKRPTYLSLAILVLFAGITVASMDLLLGKLVPIIHRREVQEGMLDLDRTDPETLVIGSSHARTFHVLGLELAARTHGQRSLVAVPLEYGKLRSYAWLLDHRIVPLLDQSRPSGKTKSSALKRLIILTEWWDSCTGPDWNLPSRAWTFSDLLNSIVTDGITSYNRNYLQSRWKRLFWDSALAQDRGTGNLYFAARERLSRHATSPTDIESKTADWQVMIEDGLGCIGDSKQMAGLLHLLDFGKTYNLETTIILFPRKPGTLTPKSKATTLTAFRKMIDAIAEPRHVRVADLTWSSPLTDQDFMADFDHVNAAGNLKFASWALDGPLSFLTQPPESQDSQVRP